MSATFKVVHKKKQQANYSQPFYFLLVTQWRLLGSKHNLTQMSVVGMNKYQFFMSWLERERRKRAGLLSLNDFNKIFDHHLKHHFHKFIPDSCLKLTPVLGSRGITILITFLSSMVVASLFSQSYSFSVDCLFVIKWCGIVNTSCISQHFWSSNATELSCVCVANRSTSVWRWHNVPIFGLMPTKSLLQGNTDMRAWVYLMEIWQKTRTKRNWSQNTVLLVTDNTDLK